MIYTRILLPLILFLLVFYYLSIIYMIINKRRIEIKKLLIPFYYWFKLF